jgi:NAD(P)H-dependent FMN reductase
MKLAVILGTTRLGRQSEKQALWVVNAAAQLEDVEVELIDLNDYPMPFFAEPISPRYNPAREIDAVAEKWLARLDAADAYIFVTPEYNHSIPGVLKNALDYIGWELNRKPAAIVSHGAAGGARAAMHLKDILSVSNAVVIPNTVAFHGVSDGIDEAGNISEALKLNPYGPQASLDNLLAELKWYSDALVAARIPVAAV